ncbi:MAG: hypothetical protein AMXMBFR33_12470 [Candidatus Xenobia bacterium]
MVWSRDFIAGGPAHASQADPQQLAFVGAALSKNHADATDAAVREKLDLPEDAVGAQTADPGSLVMGLQQDLVHGPRPVLRVGREHHYSVAIEDFWSLLELGLGDQVIGDPLFLQPGQDTPFPGRQMVLEGRHQLVRLKPAVEEGTMNGELPEPPRIVQFPLRRKKAAQPLAPPAWNQVARCPGWLARCGRGRDVAFIIAIAAPPSKRVVGQPGRGRGQYQHVAAASRARAHHQWQGVGRMALGLEQPAVQTWFVRSAVAQDRFPVQALGYEGSVRNHLRAGLG